MSLPAESHFDGNSEPLIPHLTLSAIAADGTVVSERFPLRPAPHGIARVSTLALQEFLAQLPPAQVSDSVYLQFDPITGVTVPDEFSTLQEPAPEDASFYLGNKNLEIQPLARLALLKSVPLHLEPLEFDLLALLSRHPDEVLTYSRVIDSVWEGRKQSRDPKGSLSTLVARTRRILGPLYGDSKRGIIQGVHLVGYRGAFTLGDRIEESA